MNGWNPVYNSSFFYLFIQKLFHDLIAWSWLVSAFFTVKKKLWLYKKKSTPHNTLLCYEANTLQNRENVCGADGMEGPALEQMNLWWQWHTRKTHNACSFPSLGYCKSWGHLFWSLHDNMYSPSHTRTRFNHQSNNNHSKYLRTATN